jgi:hypothetical protein
MLEIITSLVADAIRKLKQNRHTGRYFFIETPSVRAYIMPLSRPLTKMDSATKGGIRMFVPRYSYDLRYTAFVHNMAFFSKLL